MPTFDPEYGRETKAGDWKRDYVERNDNHERMLEFCEAKIYQKGGGFSWADLNEDAFQEWLAEKAEEAYEDDNYYGKGDPDDRGDR